MDELIQRLYQITFGQLLESSKNLLKVLRLHDIDSDVNVESRRGRIVRQSHGVNLEYLRVNNSSYDMIPLSCNSLLLCGFVYTTLKSFIN